MPALCETLGVSVKFLTCVGNMHTCVCDSGISMMRVECVHLSCTLRKKIEMHAPYVYGCIHHCYELKYPQIGGCICFQMLSEESILDRCSHAFISTISECTKDHP